MKWGDKSKFLRKQSKYKNSENLNMIIPNAYIMARIIMTLKYYTHT